MFCSLSMFVCVCGLIRGLFPCSSKFNPEEEAREETALEETAFEATALEEAALEEETALERAAEDQKGSLQRKYRNCFVVKFLIRSTPNNGH